MQFKDFSEANRVRCESPHGFNHKMGDWSLSDWFTATMGELGEAANVAKKLNRVRDGIPGNSETPERLRQMLADEIADTFIYLDLLAQSEGIDLESAVAFKFNSTSAKIGYPETLRAQPPPAGNNARAGNSRTERILRHEDSAAERPA